MPDPSQFNTDRTYLGRWTITFSNPPINMFVPATIVELGALMTDLEADPPVKVVVFQSANPDFFIAYLDVSKAAERPEVLDLWRDFVLRLSSAPVVSIASLHQPPLYARLKLPARSAVAPLEEARSSSSRWEARAKAQRIATSSSSVRVGAAVPPKSGCVRYWKACGRVSRLRDDRVTRQDGREGPKGDIASSKCCRTNTSIEVAIDGGLGDRFPAAPHGFEPRSLGRISDNYGHELLCPGVHCN